MNYKKIFSGVTSCLSFIVYRLSLLLLIFAAAPAFSQAESRLSVEIVPGNSFEITRSGVAYSFAPGLTVTDYTLFENDMGFFVQAGAAFPVVPYFPGYFVTEMGGMAGFAVRFPMERGDFYLGAGAAALGTVATFGYSIAGLADVAYSKYNIYLGAGCDFRWNVLLGAGWFLDTGFSAAFYLANFTAIDAPGYGAFTGSLTWAAMLALRPFVSIGLSL
jgi:hypothetical protein